MQSSGGHLKEAETLSNPSVLICFCRWPLTELQCSHWAVETLDCFCPSGIKIFLAWVSVDSKPWEPAWCILFPSPLPFLHPDGWDTLSGSRGHGLESSQAGDTVVVSRLCVVLAPLASPLVWLYGPSLLFVTSSQLLIFLNCSSEIFSLSVCIWNMGGYATCRYEIHRGNKNLDWFTQCYILHKKPQLPS